MMANYFPPFWFSIDCMGPNELVRPRVVAPGGIWQPPIVRNGNLLLRTGTTGHMFLFDGNGVRQAGPVDACRQAYPLQEYRTTSIYYDHSRFWVLPGDATSLAAPTEEWGSIGFDWNRNLGRWCSYIERNGEKTELQLQRNDQEWVKKLLPRDYRAATVLNDPRYGGLIGDLTLILGLVAFSVPYGNVAGALSHCLRDNRWRGPVNNNHGGWIHERGIVVRIWTGGFDGCTSQRVYGFEEGQNGRIFT